MIKTFSLALVLSLTSGLALANTSDTSLLDDLNSYAYQIGNADDLFSTVLDMVVPIHASFLSLSQTLFYALSLLALAYALGNRVFGGRTSPLAQLGAIFLCLVLLSPVTYVRSEFTLNNTELASRSTLLNTQFKGDDNLEVSWFAKASHFLIGAVSSSIREAIDWGYDVATGGSTSEGLPLNMFQSLAASQAKHLPESPDLRKNYLYYNQVCGASIDSNTPGSASAYNYLGLNGGSGLSLNLKADYSLIDDLLTRSGYGVLFADSPDYYLMAHNPSVGGNDIESYMEEPVLPEAANIDMSEVLEVLDYWKDENNTLSGKTNQSITEDGFKIPSQAYWQSTFIGKPLNNPSDNYETVPILSNDEKPLHFAYYNPTVDSSKYPDGYEKKFFASSCYDLYRIAARSMINFQRALLIHQGWDNSGVRLSTHLDSILPNSIHAYNVLATDRVELDKIYKDNQEDLAGDSYSGGFWSTVGDLIDEAVAVVAGAGVEIEKVYSDWGVQYWLPVALVTLALVYGLVFSLLPFLILFSVFAGRYGSVILGLQVMIMMHVAYLIAYFFAKAGGLIVQVTLNAATAAFSASTVQAQNILPFTVAGELTIYAGLIASLPLAYIITFNEKMGFKNLSARHTGLQSQIGAAAGAALGGKYIASKAAGAAVARQQAISGKAALAATKVANNPTPALKSNTGTASIGRYSEGTASYQASQTAKAVRDDVKALAAAGRGGSDSK